MSARHALVLAAAIASAPLHPQLPVPSDDGSLGPVACGMRYRNCLCRYVDAQGWRCTGFVMRPASEEPPKFQDLEPSRPPEPSESSP